ncbi:MAG: hypothetical protein R3C46_10550 [Hyphomonadaceae bacterium]
MTDSPTYVLGIVFDIDSLEKPFYGLAAYRILFRKIFAADRELLANSLLRDGDTSATLSGNARDCVISIETCNGRALERIIALFEDAPDQGLKPKDCRFLFGQDAAREPLVLAARVNDLCVIDWCDNSDIVHVWNVETTAMQNPSGAASDGEAGRQRKPQ